MGKEEILRKVMIDAYEEYWNEKAPIGNLSFFTDIREFHVYEAMDEWAMVESIGFFKWYVVKMMGFIEYLRDIKPIVTSNEIEEKILEFEGKPIETLYQLYQQSKTPTNNGQ